MDSARIMAIGSGGPQPLFDTEPVGLPSPSRSLLIESHRGKPGAVQTRAIPEQVLTLFVEPGLLEHAQEDGVPTRLAVSAGAVAISLRNRLETVRWTASCRVMSVRIEDCVLDGAAVALGRGRFHELAPSSGVLDERLTALLRTLYLEQAKGFPAGRLFIDCIEQAIATLLVGGYARDGRPGPEPAGMLPARLARRVEELVHVHLGRCLSLEELASCAGYSPSHFSWLFRRTFGMTPHRYVQRMRIDRAMTLLARRSCSILDVALGCGFQTQQHFSRVFRAHTGMSPGEFRRSR